MTAQIPFSLRADDCLRQNSDVNPLKVYLLQLMSIKRTNLCVSADVTTTSALLKLADTCGPFICIFKTHADIVEDFGPRTIKGLRELSKKHKFLIFEDRKFGDIGSTVKLQYTAGTHRIASWAHIVNAHVFPGPSIVTALRQAAASVIEAESRGLVSTEVWAGTPQGSEDEATEVSVESPITDRISGSQERPSSTGLRKDSIVANTIISQVVETTSSSQRSASLSPVVNQVNPLDQQLKEYEEDLEALEDPPMARALLLFAQMSSEGNLMNKEYTRQTLEMGRSNKDFVIGFIAQRNLNDPASGDDFLSLTPGVQLPAPGEGDTVAGDGLGQQYRTPAQVIGKDGCDIVIVGRGIYAAKNKAEAAQRYKHAAWMTYTDRLRTAK